MDSEKKYTKVPEDIVRENYSLQKRNSSLKYLLGGFSLLLIILILFFSLSGETNYEKGMKYLHEKQYPEALFEFQKVGPDETDFKLAQSKINYINGLKAYTNDIPSVALTFLMKVDPSDQYYRETRLIIDKINLTKKTVVLESLSEQVNKVKDTVIIKEQPVYTERESVNDADAKSSVTKKNKIQLSNIQKLVNQFEYQYQSAISSKDDSKKVYLKTLDSLYKDHIRTNLAGEEDFRIAEINTTVSTYMQKRIDLINELIADNSNNFTDTSRMIKEEGDKVYSKLLTLLTS